MLSMVKQKLHAQFHAARIRVNIGVVTWVTMECERFAVLGDTYILQEHTFGDTHAFKNVSTMAGVIEREFNPAVATLALPSRPIRWKSRAILTSPIRTTTLCSSKTVCRCSTGPIQPILGGGGRWCANSTIS